MRRLWFLALLLPLAAACGSTKTVTVTTTVTRTVTTTAPAATKSVRVYFMRDGKVGPVAREVETTDRTSLLAALDAGPTDAERAIGFTQGMGNERTAEEVYTLSQLAPQQAVDVGGQSYTRADFEDLTPAILVEAPLPFATVSAPLRLRGTANTFEATFEYQLLDSNGKTLAKHFVTATSGSGTRGTYDVAIPFGPPGGTGKLVVYELSAADGSRIHQVEIPLTFIS
jgi:Immunoglobulin-like domain of bacterial spore germination